jgi:hypothetical protein
MDGHASGSSGDGSGRGASAGGRYFVTVYAPGREALLALSQHDLDLFKPTAREADPGELRIDGLLTLEEIGRLVDAGYRVLVQTHAAHKARGQITPRRAEGPDVPGGAALAGTQAVGFEEWLKGFQEPEPRARPPRPPRPPRPRQYRRPRQRPPTGAAGAGGPEQG